MYGVYLVLAMSLWCRHLSARDRRLQRMPLSTTGHRVTLRGLVFELRVFDRFMFWPDRFKYQLLEYR